eukprot:jgi/Psemu1/304691/fgenesh1_kg.165_\
MYCPYQDEAERINAGIAEQDGYMIADFAHQNTPSGVVKGKPTLVSKNPADVISDADVLIMPLPSFAYPVTLRDIKPYLREGQILCVTPGQGGFDWFAKDVLGTELMNKITILGLMPMPFNCRISTFGKHVNVQALKKHYSIGVIPSTAYSKCEAVVKEMFGGTVNPAGRGTFLECSMFPMNAVIHPSRLYTMLASWKEGEVLDDNPLFYEGFTPEGANYVENVSKELVSIGKGLTDKGVEVYIPRIYDWSACYLYGWPRDSDLLDFYRNNDAYKGFRCPFVRGIAKDGKEGFVPDFNNRYFTEDIPLGLCVYKGLADIAEVQTPFIDTIIMHFQSYMGKQFVVNGKLEGKDVVETSAPQRFGLTTISDLQKVYC